jgi:GGDEF domain-containing protein
MKVEQAIIAQLLSKIEELSLVVEDLSKSPSYGVLTRQGVERKWKSIEKRDRALLLIDVDNLHNLNEKYGYEEMNRRISRGLDSLRSAELLGLVYSGDEFIAVVKEEEAIACSRRIAASFKENGITLTIAIISIDGEDFTHNYCTGMYIVQDLKKRGLRDRVCTEYFDGAKNASY